jgi:hypothetical protein
MAATIPTSEVIFTVLLSVDLFLVALCREGSNHRPAKALEKEGAPSAPPFQGTTAKRLPLYDKHTRTRDFSRVEGTVIKINLVTLAVVFGNGIRVLAAQRLMPEAVCRFRLWKRT